MLGASEFPDSRLEGSVAFSNAAHGFSNYLLNESGFCLSAENLLPLFNSNYSPDAIDESIHDFLTKRLNEAEASGQPISDLIVYYVGHGFFDENQSYRLAIQKTRDRNLQVSSLAMTALNTTICGAAPQVRTYFLLDACFSAEAARVYQSGADNLLKERIRDLPTRGAAFLCSSSAKAASRIAAGGEITVFSDALLHVLWNGCDFVEGSLTLENLKEAVSDQIVKRNGRNAVRPEIHVPLQTEGNISSTVHLFPNNPRQAAIEKAKREAIVEAIRKRKEQEGTPLQNVTPDPIIAKQIRKQWELEERNRLRVQSESEESQLSKNLPTVRKLNPSTLAEAEQVWERDLSHHLVLEWLRWKIEQVDLDKNILEYGLEVLHGKVNTARVIANNVYSHYEADKKLKSDRTASRTFLHYHERMKVVWQAEKSVKAQKVKIALSETTCRVYHAAASARKFRRLLLRVSLYRRLGQRASVAAILERRAHRARAFTSLTFRVRRIIRSICKWVLVIAIVSSVLWLILRAK
jgi:hypothetical protein